MGSSRHDQSLGFTAPGHNTAWGGYNAAGGWLCTFMDHYSYTLNRERLRILSGDERSCSSISPLREDPYYGKKVPVPSMSYGNTYYLPMENRDLLAMEERQSFPLFLCMGSTADVQMIRQLFTHVIAANKILQNTDDFPLIHNLEEALEHLPEYKVNAMECLQRWLYDYPEEDVRRNVPHLYALIR